MTFPALGGLPVPDTVAAPILNGDSLAGRVSELERRLDAFADAHVWQTYTPTWTASTDPAIGNGTLTGRYLWVGRLAVVELYMNAGSTTTFGAGTWQFGLPVEFKDDIGDGNQTLGVGYADDDSTGTFWHQVMIRGTPATNTAGRPHNGTSSMGASNPFAWAQSDSLWATLVYETATVREI